MSLGNASRGDESRGDENRGDENPGNGHPGNGSGGDPARGVRFGVDVGEARVGVALCDPDGLVATPLVTLARDRNPREDEVPSDMSELARLVADYGTVEVVVGLPRTLAGVEGHAAQQVRAYAQRLAPVLDPVPVTMADERMSTVAATRRLSERGVRGRRQRKVVDQVAAAEILQGWLDARRRRT